MTRIIDPNVKHCHDIYNGALFHIMNNLNHLMKMCKEEHITTDINILIAIEDLRKYVKQKQEIGL